MTISMYQSSVPVLKRTLTNLVSILEKGAAYAEAKSIEPIVLINSRLYPRYVSRLLSRFKLLLILPVVGWLGLAGVEAPSIEDDETTFGELITRLQKTVAIWTLFLSEPSSLLTLARKILKCLSVKAKPITMQGWPFLTFFRHAKRLFSCHDYL